ncbi:MAG: Gfo/Idh/MocA family oxidoreductase [Phycisphaerales bacterium]|nr:Gfo/Idh/MocA family oxidoreductase [Phycisphaerales bacterium]
MMDKQTQSQPTQVGILGFGFMGRTHATAYQSAHREGHHCNLAMIADPNLNALQSTQTTGNIEQDQSQLDLSNTKLTQDPADIINEPAIDLISICTHTDTHVDLAIQALNAGKHVLIEKPIAIRSSDVQRLVSAAKDASTLCIPAMCMRHWPAWVKIHECIHSKTFGRVRSAAFHRLGSRPNWSTDFYADDTRSGGVLHDLHIHDTDFIVHCFGTPNAVTTVGDHLHLTTLYHYDSDEHPIHITAQAAWDHQPSVGYRMRCTIVCEHATLDFDFSAEHQLVIHQGDESTPVNLSPLSGYDAEIRWMLDQINTNSITHRPIHDALMVAQVLEAEARSITSNTRVQLS